MLTVAALLAAMTIAGAFWVGVLAARRLRDWGEGRRALDEGGPAPLALAGLSSSPPDDASSRRVRALVAQRLKDHRGRADGSIPPQPRGLEAHHHPSSAGERSEDLGLDNLRVHDVAILDGPGLDPDHTIGRDFIIEGVINLREGTHATVIVNLADGDRRRWLVGSNGQQRWMLVAPVGDHGLSGEPPRHIRRERGLYTLERRGQASVACVGRHDRPAQSRVATYIYRASGRDILWVERWGREVLVGEGQSIEAHSVSFLPGS